MVPARRHGVEHGYFEVLRQRVGNVFAAQLRVGGQRRGDQVHRMTHRQLRHVERLLVQNDPMGHADLARVQLAAIDLGDGILVGHQTLTIGSDLGQRRRAGGGRKHGLDLDRCRRLAVLAQPARGLGLCAGLLGRQGAAEDGDALDRAEPRLVVEVVAD